MLGATRLAIAAPDVAPESRAEALRTGDAMVERGVLATHAETSGAGSSTLSLHEGALLSAAHAFSDDLQLSGGGLVPLWPGAPWAGFVQGKLVVARSRTATVALRSTGSVLTQRGGSGVAATLGAGVLVDAHPPPRWLSLHGGLSLHGARGTPISRVVPFDGDAALVLLELGAVVRFHRRTALLAEAWLPVTADDEAIMSFPVAMVPWAFRWGGPRLALDVGVVSGSPPLVGDSPLGIGWPYVAVGMRRPRAPGGAQ